VHIEPPANPAAGQAAEFAFVAIHTYTTQETNPQGGLGGLSNFLLLVQQWSLQCPAHAQRLQGRSAWALSFLCGYPFVTWLFGTFYDMSNDSIALSNTTHTEGVNKG
jgi:hypothetical protein